jgi:hypothetical protein
VAVIIRVATDIRVDIIDMVKVSDEPIPAARAFVLLGSIISTSFCCR